MKKLFLILVMAFTAIVSVSAGSSNAYAYVKNVSYNKLGTTITVTIELTKMANDNYKTVKVQVSPSSQIEGLIVDQYKTVTLDGSRSPVDKGDVTFTCTSAGQGSDMCNMYHWDITIVDTVSK